MSVQLTAEQEVQLAEIARESSRSKDEVAQEAVEGYIRYRGSFVHAVQEGLRAADRGELHDDGEVMAMMDDIIANG